jgi:hypothetical protein
LCRVPVNAGTVRCATKSREFVRHAPEKGARQRASQYGFYVHQAAISNSLIKYMKSPAWQNPYHKIQHLYQTDDFVRQTESSGLLDGVAFADEAQFQTGENSYRHAMRNQYQSVKEAEVLADLFVRQQFAIAKQLLLNGDYYNAYFQFAIGLHTLQDATSPAHGGFQVWTGPDESPTNVINHILKEYKYPGEQSYLQKITDQYIYWFMFNNNEPLPSENLFTHIYIDY